MIDILEELREGSTEIGPNYKKCFEMWSEVLDDASDLSVSQLAQRVSFFRLQYKIEQICGGRSLGKTVTAISGFHYLNDREADPQLKKKLLQAFEESDVSIEVKLIVEKFVPKLFHI